MIRGTCHWYGVVWRPSRTPDFAAKLEQLTKRTKDHAKVSPALLAGDDYQLTAEKIEASNPVLYREWRARRPGFEYPEGEKRADFLARIERGVERLLAGDARLIVLVSHKGVIRTISDQLAGDRLGDTEPPLGGVVQLTKRSDGHWYVGRRSTNPTGSKKIP